MNVGCAVLNTMGLFMLESCRLNNGWGTQMWAPRVQEFCRYYKLLHYIHIAYGGNLILNEQL